MTRSHIFLLCLASMVAHAAPAQSNPPEFRTSSNVDCVGAAPGFEISLEGWIVDAAYASSDSVINKNPRLPNGKSIPRLSNDIKDVSISFAAKADIRAELCMGPTGPKLARIIWSADDETIHGSVKGAGIVAGDAAGMIMNANHQVYSGPTDRRGIAVWTIVDAQVTPNDTGETITRKMTLAGAQSWPPFAAVDGTRIGWALIVLRRCLRFASCKKEQMERVVIPTCVYYDTCHDAVGGRI